MAAARTYRCVLLWLMLLLAATFVVATDEQDPALDAVRNTYSREGPKAALPQFQALLSRYRSENNRRLEAITLGLMGNCYKRMGDYAKALDLLDQALQMKREIHDRLEEGRTLSHIGLVYWETAEYPKAVAHFEESITIARELHDAQLEASALNNLSLVYDEQGEYGRSLEQYKQALELHRSVGYEPGQSDTLGNIGGVYLLLGRYEQAAEYYQRALAISRRLQLKPSETQDLGNLALCKSAIGQLRESLEDYDGAIRMAGDAGMAKEEADWIRAKATVLLSLGRFDEALKSYERARASYTKAGLKRELIEVHEDLGHAHLALGDRDEAAVNFRKAIKISDETGHKRGSADTRLALAEVLRSNGSYIKAAQLASESEARARSIDDAPAAIRALLILARIRQNQRRGEHALQATQQALSAAEEHHLALLSAEAWDQLSEIQLDRRSLQAALTSSDHAFPVASASGDLDLLWRVKFHRGKALEALGRESDALVMYRESVNVIETARAGIAEQRYRTGFLRDKQKVYISLVRLLLKMGKTGDAFSYSERLREYSYSARVRSAGVAPESEKLAALRARIRKLEDMEEAEKARSGTEQRASALRLFSEELVSAQREYEAMQQQERGTPGPIAEPNLSRLRESIPPRSAIVEFVVDRDRLITFVLTRRSLHAKVSNVSEKDLRSRIELLRALIRQKDTDHWRKPAQSLYADLVAPLEGRGWLANTQNLLLVPHGVLNYLPFAALSTSVGRDAKALIENYQLAELPTAMSLLSLPDRGHGRRDSLVAFAPSRAHLQFAIPEAQAVAHSFGPHSVAVTGQSATETRFKQIAGQYGMIHLATHGYFNRVNPAFSGLQLESDAKNDGRLEAYEIAAMHLNATLVTLSACDTGIGGSDFDEIPAGDEFVGLNRAFLEAGSRAVLASLWEVNDRSTLILMQHLYSALNERSGIAALAESQRAMLRDSRYRHPYYWASFAYVGKDFSPERILAKKR